MDRSNLPELPPELQLLKEEAIAKAECAEALAQARREQRRQELRVALDSAIASYLPAALQPLVRIDGFDVEAERARLTIAFKQHRLIHVFFYRGSDDVWRPEDTSLDWPVVWMVDHTAYRSLGEALAAAHLNPEIPF